MKTETFRSIFYILLVFVLYYNSGSLPRLSGFEPQFIWLASILYFFIPFSPWHSLLFFLLTVVFSIICIFNKNRFFRILLCFFFILLFSIKYSFGKVNHSCHIWFFASFFFIFIDESKKLHSPKNRLVLRLIQSTLLLSYFSSGLWKLIYLETFSLDHFKDTVHEHIAYIIAEGGTPIKMVLDFFVYQYPSLLTLGFLFIIGFQIFSIVPIITERFFIPVGLCAVFFHTMTHIVMDVVFTPYIIASLYFLVYTEWMLAKERKNLQAGVGRP